MKQLSGVGLVVDGFKSRVDAEAHDKTNASIAQLLERDTSNVEVADSAFAGGMSLFGHFEQQAAAFFSPYECPISRAQPGLHCSFHCISCASYSYFGLGLDSLHDFCFLWISCRSFG